MKPKTNREARNNENIIRQVQKLMEQKGRATQESARKLMLADMKNIQSTTIREALHYFATKYWNDLARPTLMSLACEAVGSDCQSVAAITVPIMLITAGMDLHDDVIDESAEKNGRPTVYGKFGKDITLLAGDALLFKGFMYLRSALQSIKTEKAKEVARIVQNTFFELGDAEALELQLKTKIDVDPEEYLSIVKRKAADVEAYTHTSALLGGGSKEEVKALRDYGRILGMLTILRDDLIDTYDQEELLHRLKSETVPVAVLYAAQDPEVETKIKAIMCTKKMTVQDMAKLIHIAEEGGGVAKTEQRINNLVRQGLLALKPIKRKRGELTLLVNMMKTV
jgi:geranylgeranyl pyrophosphate synthase